MTTKSDGPVGQKPAAAKSEAAADSTPPGPETPATEVPSALPSEPPVGLPAAGADPDSVARMAKHQLATTDPSGDEHAREQLDKAAKARSLVAERNGAAPERVAAIDAELAALGFEGPLPTTAAQRGEPTGRGTRQERLRRTSPRT